MSRDWQNVFVISWFFSMHFTITGLRTDIVPFNGVIVIQGFVKSEFHCIYILKQFITLFLAVCFSRVVPFLLEGSAMEDSTPLVVNASFSLITAVVIILLVNTVLAIGALVRLGVINPELIVVVILEITVVAGVNVVVIAICFNELIVEISDIVVDVGSFHVAISSCVETGLDSELLVEIFDVVDDVGFVHVEMSDCDETGLVSKLLVNVDIVDVVVDVASSQVEVSGCIETSLASLFVDFDDVKAFRCVRLR